MPTNLILLDEIKGKGIKSCWTGRGSSTAYASDGLFSAMTVTDDSSAAKTDADVGRGLTQTTSSVANNDAFTHPAVAVLRTAFLDSCVLTFELEQLTLCRMFVGLTDDVTLLSADDPATESLGLQFSSARSDTNFQFSGSDGTTQRLVDTGVVADGSVYHFHMKVYSTSSIVLSLYDSTWNLLKRAEFTTRIPAATTDLYLFSGITTLTTAAKSLTSYKGVAHTNR